ncbi:MAG: glyceraldehyde 3-phosphate dehydrogenase NAD-binding domain-containing protein [Alphaproteobacteria bacterium]
MTRAIRIGINGFGRIGRQVARMAVTSPDLEIAAVNDLAPNVENLAYLYNYDSTFGRAPVRANAFPARGVVAFGNREAPFFAQDLSLHVPWQDHGVEILIEATGVAANVRAAKALVAAGRVRKVIVTHSPDEGVDRYIIMGINDSDYDDRRDHVVSNTICDANAIAHPLLAIDRKYGIDSGFVTTLHPWLSYQNLVDAPVGWQQRPGQFWTDFSLGRMSTGTLIPKSTTAVTTLAPILPAIAKRLGGFSFRTPTHIVSCADLTLRLRCDTTGENLGRFLADAFEGSPYVGLNRESLVGVDYVGSPLSATIDMQWVQVVGRRMAKLVLWYDNEWGYSSRVMDMARLMSRGAAPADRKPAGRGVSRGRPRRRSSGGPAPSPRRK